MHFFFGKRVTMGTVYTCDLLLYWQCTLWPTNYSRIIYNIFTFIADIQQTDRWGGGLELPVPRRFFRSRHRSKDCCSSAARAPIWPSSADALQRARPRPLHEHLCVYNNIYVISSMAGRTWRLSKRYLSYIFLLSFISTRYRCISRACVCVCVSIV